jgi:hypothetical protein
VTFIESRGVNEHLAALRQEIEEIELEVWLGETGPDEASAEPVERKAALVAEVRRFLDERHAWRERLRARACRKWRWPYVPMPRPLEAWEWDGRTPEPAPSRDEPLFPGGGSFPW